MNDHEVARSIAREAGALLRDLRASTGELDPADRTGAAQLRALADREAHLLIAARLADLRPDDHLLSEEGVDDASRLTAARLWIVDPLDGTWEYGQGRDDYAVHVALWEADAHAGALTAACVDLPAQGRCWSTDDVSSPVAALPADRPVRVVVSRSRRPARLDDTLARLAVGLAERGLTGRGVELRQVGSVGAKAATLFAGEAEIYLHDSGFHDWDLAAPLAVAEHLGLRCWAPDGSAPVFNLRSVMQPGVVMAVPAVADLVADVLQLR